MINLITNDTLSQLSQSAKENSRLRKNLNFHSRNEAHCHRLLNALEPGTYIPPHRHQDMEKDETIVILKGRFGVLIFDEVGAVTEQFIIAESGTNLGVTIPAGVFHSMLSLESGSVFFESKAGPYAALTDAEKASWAPSEGDPDSAAFLEKMRVLFIDHSE